MTEFVTPQQRIKSVFDLNPWFFSKGYSEYMQFLKELNESVKRLKTTADVRCNEQIIKLVEGFDTIQKWIDETELEPTEEQRFGNKAFRKFYEKLSVNAENLLRGVLPASVHEALVELLPYFVDSFGNATRIDYGSGHEANYLIFLLCLRKLEVFTASDSPAVVLRVFNKYLRICRALQTKFHMEPAGSRGVHAIDDFQFAPFIFGSAQLIGNRRLVPDSYVNKTTVEDHAHESLFLDAVLFIFQTKTGPFHEHSNQLWNISAVANWDKVNEGMFKMYEGEVLKKFPVVQHLVFGSLFSFERRENVEESENMEVAEPSYGEVVETGQIGEKPMSTAAEHAPPPMYEP
ncbi:unnamed protein product [Caenorhabditis auriculariae]|uniref:Serine/threonine-protein phosphatase 2A activator n=1 Tax=Caenorhabditis auriculariae TaxID=2777116 RepID=A0A8S1GXL9_9PELO|nr:unnamed protein product [Caenorhabditis auriculariae]